jgi:hypothetical protein
MPQWLHAHVACLLPLPSLCALPGALPDRCTCCPPQALMSGSTGASAEQQAEQAEHAFTLCYELGAQIMAASSASGSSLPADVDSASGEGHLMALCLEHARLAVAAGATSSAAAEKLLAAGSSRRSRRAAASDEPPEGFDMNQAAVEEVALVQVGAAAWCRRAWPVQLSWPSSTTSLPPHGCVFHWRR